MAEPSLHPDLETDGSPFARVPIAVTISVGVARPTVKELLRLKQDDVLPLDKRIEDPVELYVGDRLIAHGELEEVEGDPAGQIAVRLTKIVDLKSGL
ncbi:FliM/FliN family flagellar motor C-terminal domain-containing protein [Aliiroseovarius sp. F20344]|uniref:FliM/FliN family flagellar motor switch protein n=1 Tax=Aliiroseovarius sp. F20344 TaxID=2926414 RepID=UPI001FF1418F|nr:FliM/FliN family flagellar motor C-terminal domain-containing protein [Aliiroseovarius sp. F20344]MCK0141757.1 FliM/FliN family flagellar motor C-terminal domain-containing protein [Aliiroseovarius sp. F20344]